MDEAPLDYATAVERLRLILQGSLDPQEALKADEALEYLLEVIEGERELD